jgi:hypothetical protein
VLDDKKVAGGNKVLSEDGKKNLGGPYKAKKGAESGAGKWNFSASQRVEPARALKLLGIPAHCYN